MLTDQQIIAQLFDYGHFRGSVQRSDLTSLQITDPVVISAVASYQHFMAPVLDSLTAKHHGRASRADGAIGPATRELFVVPRCGLPDYGELRGAGSWPMPCQKVGVTFSVDKSRMPSSLTSRVSTFVGEMVAAYAEVGLKLVEVPSGGNIRIKWRPLPGSTIGIAQFNSQSCGDTVTCDLDTGYTDLMFELLTHEVGHNCNLGHTRTGIMAPSVRRIDPHKWSPTDPSYRTLIDYFDGGGVPVPVPDPTPDPEPPVPPLPELPPPPRRTFLDWLKDLFRF